MAGLTGKSIASAYKSLLRVDDDTNGINTAAETVTDGEGTASALRLSDDVVHVRPSNDDTTTAFSVRANGGTTLLSVDSTNSVVKAGVGAFNVLNQYAYFGVNYADFSNIATGYHYAIPFSAASGGATATNDVDFSNGTDPADTFTTADTDTQYASQIVPMMWFVPDNISIDSVTHLLGADAATGDGTSLHLKSFTFNSGSTSCLTSGELLAHSNTVVNAGNEQAYQDNWTVDEASVSSGKVILAFFENTGSVNSDYSINITVKYHLV